MAHVRFYGEVVGGVHEVAIGSSTTPSRNWRDTLAVCASVWSTLIPRIKQKQLEQINGRRFLTVRILHPQSIDSHSSPTIITS
jgi:hypothetical protein